MSEQDRKQKWPEQTCEYCRFWSNELLEWRDEVGFCHRYPPQLLHKRPSWTDDGRLVYGGHFPATMGTEWCGEWAEKKVEDVK